MIQSLDCGLIEIQYVRGVKDFSESRLSVVAKLGINVALVYGIRNAFLRNASVYRSVYHMRSDVSRKRGAVTVTVLTAEII